MRQIATAFEIFYFSSRTEGDQVITSYLPPAGERALTKLLLPHKLDKYTFTQYLNRTADFKQQYPWVILAFPKEYRLAGHIYSRRSNPEDPKFSSYTILRDYGSDPMKKPPDCSLLVFFDRIAAEDIKNASYFFQLSWELIKDKPEGRSWLVFAPPLDEDWVRETEKVDANLFYTHYVPTEYDLAAMKEEGK